VKEFREIVHDLQRAVNNPLPEFFDYLLLRTGYRRMLQESRDMQDETRLQNIDELVNSAREFWELNGSSSLADYLDSLTLMSDLDKYESQKGVTLMTLHSAKGLEFKIVFLAGMEEGILPHSNSRDESEDIEEERRLCYVGMTRAREQLYCLHALERRLHGRFREQSASQFLDEIPDEVKEPVRLVSASTYSQAGQSWRERPVGAYSSDRYGNERYGSGYGSSGSGSYGRGSSSGSNSYGRPTQSRPPMPPKSAPPAPPKPAPLSRAQESTNSVFSFFKDAPVQFDPSAIRPAAPEAPKVAAELKRGQRVRHEQFGDGTILTMEGSGPDAKLTVYFDRAGSKKFIAKYAKLMRV